MSSNRIPVLQQIATSMRSGDAVDVYHLARQLRASFPGVSQDRLVQIVTEEVVKARANAMWLPRNIH